MTAGRYRLLILATLILSVLGDTWSNSLADPHRFATVSALGVGSRNGHAIGNVHYIAIQLDQDLQDQGPRVLFSEISRGSAVGDDWKEGVRVATVAAANVLGQDYQNWIVTIKNRTNSSLTDGSSSSGAVAVGIMAAWRGATIRSDVVLTGVVTPQGKLTEVDALPIKLEGAAGAHMRTMLVPRGQARTSEWDLFEQGRQRNVTVIEVESIPEAYELMISSP